MRRSSIPAIKRGVPMPKGGRNMLTKYPYADMAVGDSFFVRASDLPPSGVGSLRTSARARGMRSAVRAEGKGYRVWRIK